MPQHFNFVQVQAAAVVALLCCLVGRAAAGRCGANGPEIALSELNEECSNSKMSRSDECMSAMHEFCQKVTYGETKDTLGVSQNHTSDKIFMSCVKSEWSGWVPIHDLQKYEKECTVERGSQCRHCLAATHRFCKDALGSDDSAGISQKVVLNAFYVQCFKSPRKELVRHDVLNDKKYGTSCESDSGPFHSGYRSHTDGCFAAASKWCQEKAHLGSKSGGITQEVNKDGVLVACYKDEFSNWAYIVRSPEFYTDENTLAEVCELKFDTNKGKVLSPSIQLLQTQFYDNRGSPKVALHNVFKVSQEIVRKSSFTSSHSFTISGSATANLEVKLPRVTTGGSITTTLSDTETVSLTEDISTTETYSFESPVEVPPGEAITAKLIAHVDDLEVPWKATVITGLGHETTIEGEWRGIKAYNFAVKQVEGILTDEGCSCPMPMSLVEKEIAQLLSFVVRK